MGSTYFQNRELLPEKINWTIVEQKHFVSFGKEKLQDDNLRFEYNLSDIKNCDVIIFSGVLQYLDFYEEIVKTATERKMPFIILERTAVGSRFRIMKQIVREPIYEATYATCMFEEKSLIAMFESHGYKLIDSWSSLVDGVLQIGEDKMIDKSFVFKLNE